MPNLVDSLMFCGTEQHKTDTLKKDVGNPYKQIRTRLRESFQPFGHDGEKKKINQSQRQRTPTGMASLSMKISASYEINEKEEVLSKPEPPQAP